MPKDRRPLQKQIQLGPGPGSYNLIEKFGSNRAVIWKPERKYLKLENLITYPGPTSYNIKSTVPHLQDYEKKSMEDRGIKVGY